MSAWPTSTIDTTYLDAGTDSVAAARPAILATANAVNAMEAAYGTANGVATLDSNSQVPVGQLGNALPSGVIFPFAGSSAPSGFLLCFGQAVSRTTYANLFAAIGTSFGVGDGSTTFNLPDTRGRVLAGKDDMGGTAAGNLNAILSGTTSAGSAIITGLSSTSGLSIGMKAIGANIPSGRTIQSIDSASQVTLNSGTSVTAGTATIRFGIVDGATLGDTGGDDIHTLTTPQIPDHTHTVQAQSASSVNAGTFNTAMNTGGTTLTSSSTGGGQAHPNVQPTIIVNYIIKT